MPKEKQKVVEVLFYMIKKLQCIYKHFVLLGLNIYMCLDPSNLPWTPAWRVFWLHLNVSHGMEFFLQSLVKRKLLRQREMLHVQRILMISATLSSAIPILDNVQFHLCMASLALNFLNRYHDLFNTMLIVLVGALVRYSEMYRPLSPLNSLASLAMSCFCWGSLLREHTTSKNDRSKKTARYDRAICSQSTGERAAGAKRDDFGLVFGSTRQAAIAWQFLALLNVWPSKCSCPESNRNQRSNYPRAAQFSGY